MDILKIDALLAKPKLKNFVHRIGIELEGGWKKVPEGVELVRDGSITGLKFSTAELAAAGDFVANMRLAIGELASEPMEIRKLIPWMRQSYPSHTNETCGLHVHYSFTSALHYMWLMIPEYQNTMVHHLQEWAKSEGLKKTHPIWARLRGESQYCRLEFFPDQQAQTRRKSYNHDAPGHRYTFINYPHGQHGTMECRGLPMFEDVEQGIRAVQKVLDVTNACIAVCATREDSVKAAIEIDSNDTIVEESEEFV